MTTFVVSLITALVSAALAGAGTYFTARRDLQLKFDASLRDLRIEAYKDLWKELRKLAKYGRPGPLSKSQAEGLRHRLTMWYFDTGGLVLSVEAREDYFTFLDGLELVIARGEDVFREADDEFLRLLGSQLRTSMARDVGTRRTFIFRRDRQRDESPVEWGTYQERGGTRELEISRKRSASDEPRLDLPGPSDVHWDPARKALSVRVPQGEQRLFLFGKGLVVEGPKGWRRGESGRRQPSVIWTRRG